MTNRAKLQPRHALPAGHPLTLVPCPVCPPAVAPVVPRRCADYAAARSLVPAGRMVDMTRRTPERPLAAACPVDGWPLTADQICDVCGNRYCPDCGAETGSPLRVFCSAGACRPGLGGTVEFVGEEARDLEAEIAEARAW